MNDFTPLQEWIRKITISPYLRDNGFFSHLIARGKAKKEESYDIEYVSALLTDCTLGGELIKESNGQFTGGYSISTYRYKDEVIEFGYQDGKLCDMTRFDGELY